MISKAKAAAQWWANLLAQKQAQDEAAIAAGMPATLFPPPVSEQQIKDFEAALEREIQDMLQDDLSHVLSTNHCHICPQLCRAAEDSGIRQIRHRFPDQVIMRIFPNTVMVHIGSCPTLEIVWSMDKATYAEQSPGYGHYGNLAHLPAQPSSFNNHLRLMSGQLVVTKALRRNISQDCHEVIYR
jgi:hypothetical protein